MPDRVRTFVAVPDSGRVLFHSLLARLPQLLVVTETGDGRTALEHLRRFRFDFVLLGVPLPHTHGLAVARQAFRVLPGIRVAVVAAIDDPAFLLEALRIGVNGYLSATAPVDDLAEALQRILRGETLFDTTLSTHALLRLVASEAQIPSRCS